MSEEDKKRAVSINVSTAGTSVTITSHCEDDDIEDLIEETERLTDKYSG